MFASVQMFYGINHFVVALKYSEKKLNFINNFGHEFCFFVQFKLVSFVPVQLSLCSNFKNLFLFLF